MYLFFSNFSSRFQAINNDKKQNLTYINLSYRINNKPLTNLLTKT